MISVKMTGFKNNEEAENFMAWWDNQGKQDYHCAAECMDYEGYARYDAISIKLEDKDENSPILNPEPRGTSTIMCPEDGYECDYGAQCKTCPKI